MPDEKKPKKLTIDEIAQLIDEDTINEKIGKRHSKARAAYKSDKIDVATWDDFHKEIMDYMKHHYKSAHSHDKVSDEIALGKAKSILDQYMRRDGGYEGAFKKFAQKGKLQHIFNTLAQAIEQEEIQHYTDYTLTKHIDPDDYDRKTELAQQYIDKYSSFLPKHLQHRKAGDIAQSIRDIVDSHAEVIAKAKAYSMKKPEKKPAP